ncbi:MAG: sulfite exporter TauE/SafE family protein [Xanthobacteraceae bacterium]
MPSATLAFVLPALLAAAAVGMSKGGVPMIGILAVPILSVAMPPIAAAGLLLPVYVVSDIFGVWAYRREFSARNLLILGPSALLGIGIGWATASLISEPMVMMLVGAIGLAFCLDRWFGRRPVEARPADVPRGVFWGALTGFTSFVSHAGAPPYQMYVLPQRLPKLVFAGTSTILFAGINAAKLVPYWALGQLNPANLQAAALLAPVAVVGTFAGVWLTRIMPERSFYRLIVAALFLLSLQLLFSGAREAGLF